MKKVTATTITKGTRQAISRSTRFEVFKRDKFTCQYCGAKTPTAVLQCDHIEPVAKGGKSDILNLITSCDQCNGGKGAVPLGDSAALNKQHDMLASLEERRQQIDMMLQWRNELENLSRDTTEIVSNRLTSKFGFELSANGKANVRRWLKKYGFEETLRGIDEAFDTYAIYSDEGSITTESFEIAFKKIPGVIGILKQEDDRPYLRRLFYIQGIIRNRIGSPRYECIDYLEHLVKNGFDIDEMESRAKRMRSIEDFDGPYDASLMIKGNPYGS